MKAQTAIVTTGRFCTPRCIHSGASTNSTALN
jgi:hypothetical protein